MNLMMLPVLAKQWELPARGADPRNTQRELLEELSQAKSAPSSDPSSSSCSLPSCFVLAQLLGSPTVKDICGVTWLKWRILYFYHWGVCGGGSWVTAQGACNGLSGWTGAGLDAPDSPGTWRNHSQEFLPSLCHSVPSPLWLFAVSDSQLCSVFPVSALPARPQLGMVLPLTLLMLLLLSFPFCSSSSSSSPF